MRSPRNDPTQIWLPTSTATVPAPNAGVAGSRMTSRTAIVSGLIFTMFDVCAPGVPP